MPEQKGKRRNRQRRRGGVGLSDGDMMPTASPIAPARPQRRTGFQLPLWGNILVATVIAIVAIVLFLLPTKGSSIQYRLFFFVAYLALSALYWGKAYRQYRAGRGAS